ncbi:unnamed protein product [Chilo suppressalis]|uniref:RPGR-interacting protein 1 first C2 domain-containing protein n=1 Tax=Chilo suppressalis TaxID=168631 RepID=A0ABN8B7M9_CHISP|nr:unnamed protein product [Chilo suppressalis]
MENIRKPCDENKCRTLMEELKQNIVDLQEELSRTHADYSTRIGRLEQELCDMQTDNHRIRSEYAAAQHCMQLEEQRAIQLRQLLIEAQGAQGELETQLTIEKQKVSELEATARANDMSRLVAATIERHGSSTANLIKNDEANTKLEAVSSPYFTPRFESSPSRLEVPSRCRAQDESMDKSEQKVSDDSGFTDANNSQRRSKHEELNQLNKELTERINVLQKQMVELQDATTLKLAETSKQENHNEETVEDKANLTDVLRSIASNTYSVSKVPSKNTLDGYPHHQEIANDEKKHFTQTKTMQDVDSNLEDESPRKNLSLKSDTHNSLQIPGPLPVDIVKKVAPMRREEKTLSTKTKQLFGGQRRKSITSELSQKRKKDDNAHKTTCIKENLDDDSKSDTHSTEIRSPALIGFEEVGVKNKPVIDDKLKISTEMGVQTTNRLDDVKEERNINKEMCNVAVETDNIQRNKGQEFGLGTQTDAMVGREDRSVGPSNGPSAFAPANASACLPLQKSRGTSPDNTDAEISSLTDLPSEKEGKSPRTPLSPGEDKATTTYTDSCTEPANDYTSLSEGELPCPIQNKKISVGETKVNFAKIDPVSQRMEEALNAVGMELSRCREMLRSQRSQQRRENSRDASMMTDLNLGAPLRRKPATPCIGDAFAPNCVFTLHIGTVVLSDEAVINSRDLSLVLTWRFFDHDASMVRMKAGRVILFDVSTEYDVKVNKEFLDYLKYEELRIYICELDKQSDPFASCSLPLRDALLHTNRRADMSLALMAGPKLKQARAGRDSLDSSDEVGVLDLWCELRLHPALLPSLNNAIEKTSTPSPSTTKANEILGNNSASRLLDVNNSRDCWLAQGIASNASPYSLEKFCWPDNRSNASQTTRGSIKKDLSYLQNKHLREQSRLSLDSKDTKFCWPDNRSIASQTTRGSIKKDLSHLQNKDPREQSRLSLESKETELKQPSQQTQSTIHTVIMNEVPAKIKTSVDMMQALDSNINQNDIPTSSKQRRNTVNDSPQTHFATASWRGLVARRLIPKRARNNSITAASKRSLLEKRDDNYGPNPNIDTLATNTLQFSTRSPRPSNDVEEPPELTKTFAGSYRMLNSSKKSVTIAMDINENNKQQQMRLSDESTHKESIQVTVLWLALNEECDTMINPNVQRLYVAYEFLGMGGSELETPQSLPKPKGYADKCSFNFSKTFQLNDCDLPVIGHMATCRSSDKSSRDTKDCIIFTVISEPIEDPLGIETCRDIGHAYLYLGDLLACSGGNNSYTEVLPVRSVRVDEAVSGVLAVKLDGLDVVRRCLLLTMAEPIHKIARNINLT